MKEILRKNKYFLISAIIATIFIIIMIIADSVTALNWTVIRGNKETTALKDAKYSIEHVNWITIFYFTFQSNLLVVIYLYLRAFGIMKPKQNSHHKMFQLIVTLNITITMVTYWLILAPFSSVWTHGGFPGALKIIVTIMVHLITPIFMLIAFHKDKLQINEEGVILGNKKLLYVLIYPIIWLVLAVSIYFATRTDAHYLRKIINDHTHEFALVKGNGSIIHSSGVAIYFFLDFGGVPIGVTIGACLAIGIAFIGFGYLFIVVSNPNSKLNQKIKTFKQGK
ncbi:hypothetical protein [Mycoplasma todarodis]|uniref:Uncharacterized protein n=1 Tax=Mycoplasma todarodis TaxID=1937191 RepID=A0A4R0XNA8_9MOLU|nr:hypothetical protein [Mycoplasma todarodis]TCG10962.1 hypothetical protein C4B25_02630 [Mycoplasma todarodis]